MALDWGSERYVRVYLRDTADWQILGWDAQALFLALLRKADRSGRVHLGRQGRKAVAVVVGHPGRRDVIEAALDELLTDTCVTLENDETLLIRNYVVAQETPATATARKQAQREREKLTRGHEPSQPVTRGHAESRDVTPSLAEPSRSYPAEPFKNPLPPSLAFASSAGSASETGESPPVTANPPESQQVTPSPELSPTGTPSHGQSTGVTTGHDLSRDVTTGHDTGEGVPERDAVEAMRELWNAQADEWHVRWKGTDPGRQRKALRALKRIGGLGAFGDFVRRINASDMLCGRKPGFDFRPPGVDWFFEPKSLRKLLEGGYDNPARPSAPPVRDTYGLTVGRGEEPEGPRFATCEACGAEEAQGSTQRGHFCCSACWSACWESVPNPLAAPAELEAHVLAFLARKQPRVPEPPFSPVPPPRLEAVPAAPDRPGPKSKLPRDPFAGFPAPTRKRKAVPA